MDHKPDTKDYPNWYGNPSSPPIAIQKFEHVNFPWKGFADTSKSVYRDMSAASGSRLSVGTTGLMFELEIVCLEHAFTSACPAPDKTTQQNLPIYVAS
jgi:hypothetical protein